MGFFHLVPLEGRGVVVKEISFKQRDSMIEQIQKETGAHFIASSAQESTMCGQGTVGLEILDQVPDVDAVILPCGGGGLLGWVKLSTLSTPLFS